MSQRDSGYARIKNDNYSTPTWVTEAVIPHLAPRLTIWEPAAGSGQMVRVLRKYYNVIPTDITRRSSVDFLTTTTTPFPATNCVLTNPPYSHAREFIEHALGLMAPVNGIVCMLLRTDYDHAQSRAHLFADHHAFAKKLVLTKRIQWFEHSTASPSFNHAFYIWDHKHNGPPVIAYGP